MNIFLLILIVLLLIFVAVFIYVCKRDWVKKSAITMAICTILSFCILYALSSSYNSLKFYREKDKRRVKIIENVQRLGLTEATIGEISSYNDDVKHFNDQQTFYLKNFFVPYCKIDYIEFKNFRMATFLEYDEK